MRDPKRIARICKLLQKVWMEVPEQRLGQLLENYIFGHHERGCIFLQEDDLTEKNLTDMYNTLLKGKKRWKLNQK